MPGRRFPPLWSIEDIGAYFVGKDGGGQKLAHVYYEEEDGVVKSPLHGKRQTVLPITSWWRKLLTTTTLKELVW